MMSRDELTADEFPIFQPARIDIERQLTMHILHVVGARPNFVKAAPVMRALGRFHGVRQTLIHTGQHFDANMSDVFFQELGMPQPKHNLSVGAGSHAVQTAEIMSRFEPHVMQSKPDLVLVYGDVNSTLAAALVCAKLGIPIGHVEAGLRSFDRTMPEEINRLVTDQVSDLLFTPSGDATENLLREGIAREKIHLVGNVMIDTLVRFLPLTEACDILTRFNLQPRRYALVTLHRPSNVDDPITLGALLEALNEIGRNLPVVFPVHPRTRERLATGQLGPSSSSVLLTGSLGYLDFLALLRRARLVITDSGGIQEETTFLGVPCITVRENSERPVTVTLGTNVLVGRNFQRLTDEVQKILSGRAKQGRVPPLWDGHTAERIADAVVKWEARP
jgi:UDP-N-acetylglucosamine 2-epimerase (non-hydrolysing)